MMINTSDFDSKTWMIVEIMAEEMGVTVEELLQTIDKAKTDYLQNNLS